MIKIKIGWGKYGENEELQDKTFSDEMKAIEWLRKNHENIQHINFHWTYGKLVHHFEIIDAIRGVNAGFIPNLRF